MNSGNNYKILNDESLMEMSKKGDQKAFSEIYMRYSAKLMRFFYKMLWKNREKAEKIGNFNFPKRITPCLWKES